MIEGFLPPKKIIQLSDNVHVYFTNMQTLKKKKLKAMNIQIVKILNKDFF